MSHVTVISTPNFTSQEILVAALEVMGYKPQVFETAQELKGYSGGKTGIFCEVIVKGDTIGDLSSDWGFKRVQDQDQAGEHFQSHIDFWYEDSRDDFMDRLNRTYASEETKLVLTRQGFQWETRQDEEGNEQFVITTVGGYGAATGLDALGKVNQGGAGWSKWG